jgi:parvulin-like peptidyl-prolyl isomerase
MSSSLRTLIPLLLLALATALVAAACGSSNDKKTVPAGAIALVGDKSIPKSRLDLLIAQTKKNYEAQKQEFPAAGTPEYENVKSTLVSGLVQQAQWEQAGAAMGINVTDKEVQAQLDALKQQYFKGDDQKYRDELEKQGLTERQLREQIRAKILSDKIYNTVTGKVTVSEAEIKAYYDGHKDQYQQSKSREVRHILVKKEALADRLYNDIKDGADFAKLAEKYSQDTGSKENGGELTAYEGKTVPPFDKFVFAAKTGELSKPIKTEFGWHVIEVLSDIKPPGIQTLADVSETIKSTLLQQKQNQALKNWVRDTKAKYAVTYAPGYAPAATTTQAGAGTATG